MKLTRCVWCVALLATMAAIGGQAVRAEDRELTFLHALQEKDYADVALEYLKKLKTQPNLPEVIADVWDLEMSKSYRGMANNSFNDAEFEARMAEAQKHLNKFLEEKPNHPEAVSAMVSWGSFSVDRALQHLRAARSLTEAHQQELKESHWKSARQALTEAQPRFKKAISGYADRLKALPAAPAKIVTRADRKLVADRESVEQGALNALFQVALVDYYLAQTFSDPKNPDRVAALKRASKLFDNIWQTHRVTADNQVNVIGLYAHMWDGKVAEELADYVKAIDIYEEVLANVPEPGQAGGVTGLEPLFAQVEYFRLLVLVRSKKIHPVDFIAEAGKWLVQYKNSRQTEGYQGVTLEVAKANLSLAEKATGAEKTKFVNEAARLLNDMRTVHSPYQAEALALRRTIVKTETDLTKVTNFEEAAAMGDEAAQSDQLANALAAYNRALEMASRAKDTKRVDQVRESQQRVRLVMAQEQYGQGKFGEAFAAAEKLVEEMGDLPIAPTAAVLAVNAALGQYQVSSAQDRPAALERLEKVAGDTARKWPNKPEADDARMALGQAALVRGKVDEALDIYSKVNPKSSRYPVAQFLSAQTLWRRYVFEKTKPEKARNQAQMTADRAKVMELLPASLEAQKQNADAKKPMSKTMLETQLLLAEALIESEKFQEGADMLQPLVDLAKGTKVEDFDNTTLKIFINAVKAYVAVDAFDKAAAIGEILADSGQDIEPVNNVLIQFANQTTSELQKADAAQTKASADGDEPAAQRAQVKLKGLKEMFGGLLKKLSQRKQHSLAGMVFIGESCANLGMDGEAKEQFQRILDRVKEDPQFAAQAAKAVPRVRAQLAGLLRKEGNLAEALTQVEEVIKERPRSLEPRMEKCRILQGMAEQDPALWPKAVEHWAQLRNLLLPMKNQPPEFFEVTYWTAVCLAKQGAAMNDAAGAEKIKDAQKVLKSTIILKPTLGDQPDLVAKYEALLKELAAPK